MNNRGFTLAELCVAAGLMGLICLLAWPAIRNHVVRLSADARSESAALERQQARTHAFITDGK